MIKLFIIMTIITLLSIKLINEAGWFKYEEFILYSIIGIDIIFLGILNATTTPMETYENNTFLGATSSGFIMGLLPGIWLWGILSIIKLIMYKIKERR